MNHETPADSTPRRQFLLTSVAATAAIACGCQSTPGAGGTAHAGPPVVVDAGPGTQYAADGVYAGFRSRGFFVIRRGHELTALSALCTHRRCELTAEPDRTFHCDCHGSNFDPRGKVTQGPARRDLPVLPSSIDSRGHLVVTVNV